MTKQAMAALPGGPLVKKYVDRNGVKRCVGLKEKLKASQLIGLHLMTSFGKFTVDIHILYAYIVIELFFIFKMLTYIRGRNGREIV